MPGEPKIPTSEELFQLPRWACVAFAARCAKRVRPLFDLAWPDAGERYRRAVDWAISVAAGAAASAGHATHAAHAAEAAAHAAHAAAADAASAAPLAASAAAHAADAADADADLLAAHAAEAAADAATRAATAAATAFYAPVCLAIHRDYNLLRQAASTALTIGGSPLAIHQDYNLLRQAAPGRRYQTHVPQEFFGPLWPDGEPPGWPAQSGTSREGGGEAETAQGPRGDDELVLQVQVPEGATDEQVLDFVKQLVDKVDTLDRAYGGHGLQVDSLEATDDALVPEEVRS
jgi:hypothetical protein